MPPPDQVRGDGARSRGEAGCLAHNCHIDVENPDRLIFVEEWEDMAAVRARHPGPRSGIALPASRAFVSEMRSLSPQPPVIRIFDAHDVTASLIG